MVILEFGSLCLLIDLNIIIGGFFVDINTTDHMDIEGHGFGPPTPSVGACPGPRLALPPAFLLDSAGFLVSYWLRAAGRPERPPILEPRRGKDWNELITLI